MMDKRDRCWRRAQQRRVFKARMRYHAACGYGAERGKGRFRWFELAQKKWVQHYKTCRTPCSCWICRGEKYDRRAYAAETVRMIAEADRIGV